MQKATVIYSGFSPSRVEERIQLADDDTVMSAGLVAAALGKLGYKTSLKEILPEHLDEVGKIKSDLIFNLCEWAGRDYHLGVRVIEILEEQGNLFVGASSENFIWGAEKQLMKKLFDKHAIPTPRWFVYEGGPLKLPKNFPFPAIVKPAWEHSAIGISQNSVVWDSPALERKAKQIWEKFKQPILVEEFMDGDEYQVTVLERQGKPWVLQPAELVYQKADGFVPLLTFEEKWEEDCPEDDLSEIREFSGSPAVGAEIKTICARAFAKLKCRDFIRIDMREKNGRLYLLEVNVNPGLDWDPYYSMTISAKAAKMNFEDLVDAIVSSAKSRIPNQLNKRYESSSFV